MAIWSSSSGEDAFSPRLHEICFKTNLDYDNRLLPFDIEALAAHGRMLQACGLIPPADGAAISQALAAMLLDARSGRLAMSPEWEDCHSLIEARLIELTGEAGKRLYMARSRNDQVVQATRLYTRVRVKGIARLAADFAAELLAFAARHEMQALPGYTHTQRAMPASVGMWAASYAEIILDQLPFLRAAFELNDVNVLGSAAGYGTAFPIDREAVTADLGLARTKTVCLAAQLSRGQVECQTLQALWGIMFAINRLANDMVWMSSAEFDFLDLGKAITTGSSIMPNKKNLDPCEIVRGRYHIYTGLLSQAQGLISNLFYGYNSDYQETKPVLMQGLDLAATQIEAMGIVLANTGVKPEKCLAAFSPDIFATDEVNRQVMDGATFRDAYRAVKARLDQVQPEDPSANIRSKTHLGATANLGLARLHRQLQEWETFLQ